MSSHQTILAQPAKNCQEFVKILVGRVADPNVSLEPSDIGAIQKLSPIGYVHRFKNLQESKGIGICLAHLYSL